MLTLIQVQPSTIPGAHDTDGAKRSHVAALVLATAIFGSGCSQGPEGVVQKADAICDARGELSGEALFRKQVTAATEVYHDTNEAVTEAYFSMPRGDVRLEIVKILTGYQLCIRPRYIPLALFILRNSDDDRERVVVLNAINNFAPRHPTFVEGNIRKRAVVFALGECLEMESDTQLAEAIAKSLTQFLKESCGFDLSEAVKDEGGANNGAVSVQQIQYWWAKSGKAFANRL